MIGVEKLLHAAGIGEDPAAFEGGQLAGARNRNRGGGRLIDEAFNSPADHLAEWSPLHCSNRTQPPHQRIWEKHLNFLHGFYLINGWRGRGGRLAQTRKGMLGQIKGDFHGGRIPVGWTFSKPQGH